MYNKVKMVHFYVSKGQRLKLKKIIVFLSLKIDLVLVNSSDPVEMPHDGAFYLGRYCLQKCPFRGFWSAKG